MNNEALTLKYSPRESTREYNTFTEEYFSGADVTLYLNNEKMTQVSGLQYSIQEQLKPMYGYASRTFDEVAIGNRIVIGSFRVPITNPESSMRTDKPIPAPVSNNSTMDSKPTIPSWAVNNVRYGEVAYVNQGREYYDPSNTGQTNGTVPGRNNPLATSLSPLKYSEDTLLIQKKLLELAYSVDITGVYDLKTRRAVQAFQESCHINASGEVDKETRAFLFGDVEAGVVYGFTTESNVVLRLGPSPIFKPMTTSLPIHTKVQVIEVDGDWYKIKLDDNKKGFVAKTFISVVK